MSLASVTFLINLLSQTKTCPSVPLAPWSTIFSMWVFTFFTYRSGMFMWVGFNQAGPWPYWNTGRVFIWNLLCEAGAGWGAWVRVCWVCFSDRNAGLRFCEGPHVSDTPATCVRPTVGSLWTRHCDITQSEVGTAKQVGSGPDGSSKDTFSKNEGLGTSCAVMEPKSFREQSMAWKRREGSQQSS